MKIKGLICCMLLYDKLFDFRFRKVVVKLQQMGKLVKCFLETLKFVPNRVTAHTLVGLNVPGVRTASLLDYESIPMIQRDMINAFIAFSMSLDNVSCFGVRVSVMFHFMFVYYTFSSVWVAKWPPLGNSCPLG